MKFGYTIIYVRDVEEAVAFYVKAFKATCAFITESKQYAQLATEGVALAFVNEAFMAASDIDFTRNSSDVRPAGFEIAFVADDVGAAFDHAVSAGAVPVKAPVAKPWGQVVAYVRDNNGILVEICSPMA